MAILATNRNPTAVKSGKSVPTTLWSHSTRRTPERVEANPPQPDAYSRAYSAPEVRALHQRPVCAGRPQALRLRRLRRAGRLRRRAWRAALAVGDRRGRHRGRGCARGLGFAARGAHRHQQTRQPRYHDHHHDVSAADTGRDHHHHAPAACTAAAGPRDPNSYGDPDSDGDACCHHRPRPAPAPPPATTTTAPPPPPTTTTPAGPRQVTYSVTGTKAPGDIISVTYVDSSGRARTQHNVYIPWSMTVTPISNSDVGSVQASSLFRVSRLNCTITTSDGAVLASNTNDAPQTNC